MTLNQVTDKLLQIAAAHKQVRTARHLQPEDYLVNDYKDADYVAVWLTLQSANYSGKERFLTYLVTVADMHSPEDMNELEMQSDCLEIAYDLIAQVSWDLFDWVLVKQGNFEFFREGQEDILAGVTFEIQLKLPFVYNNCQVPTDYSLPSSNFVFINTSRFMTVYDFIVGTGQPMEDGDTTLTNNLFVVAPFVWIGGQLLGYTVTTDRRYVSYDTNTKTITINNGGVLNDESVFIAI